ncbi:MAG: hypothetical protein OXI77_15340 [Chloroflexota bacterium]|nr:hypothetical protein [Chloroflexota bacterium]MDE2910316.1 hypothetical protein [Chloroflexota bacterium]
MELVRIRSIVDVIHAEGFRQLATPLRKVADGGRPHARVGGLRLSDVNGEDGL